MCCLLELNRGRGVDFNKQQEVLVQLNNGMLVSLGWSSEHHSKAIKSKLLKSNLELFMTKWTGQLVGYQLLFVRNP